MLPRPLALVVDDDRLVRAILADVLSARGFQVIEARTGREALRVISDDLGRLGLILLDLNMPEMDGFDVLTQVGDATRKAGVPVIVLTGAAGDLARAALELGADEVLLKGATPEDIGAHVDLVLAERSRVR
jgi:DNA-binding response OmpR family regulator